MVVFTCNHCGESLQKPRVEKHYNMQCRKFKSVTCVDCFKDFKGEEYAVHTKCVTEEERYSARGSIPGGIIKKGEVKQSSWIEMIKSIVENEKDLKPPIEKLLNMISGYSNVPRKKSKFINFLNNALGRRPSLADVEAVWDIIEKYKAEQTKNEPTKEAENGTKRKLEKEPPTATKKAKKSDASEINEAKASEEAEAPDTFSYKNTILEILTAKGSVSCKKLQKKVLAAYLKETGHEEYTEKTIKKYNKKLKKLPNVVINDDVVSLVQHSEP